MAENAAGHNVGAAVGSAEKENAGLAEVSRPRVLWWAGSKPCLNIAVVHPLLDNGRSETSLSPPLSPVLSSWSPITSTDTVYDPQVRLSHSFRGNCTRQHPFSFDLRDSMQRLAREQKLEELRLGNEGHFSVAFRANPVRKYKPLVLKQSTRPLTIPKSPFSRGDH